MSRLSVVRGPWSVAFRIREAGDQLHCRLGATGSASALPSTADEATRSVDAVLATEDAVYTTRPATGETYLEVLLLDGLQLPDQLPLLDTHRRDSVQAMIGSVRACRERRPAAGPAVPVRSLQRNLGPHPRWPST